MIIENAITHLFDKFGAIAEHYGQDKARLMCEKMLNEIQLDKAHDKPLPEWAFKMLTCNYIGYRERCRLLMLHHADITGIEITHTLVRNRMKRKDWIKLGKPKSGAKWVKVKTEGKKDGSTDSEVKG
jgi:hypothetical protein